MSSPQRDTEVISLRTSRIFKERLRDWSDQRDIPMCKLLEEMGELYARTEEGTERKLSTVELLLRPHFNALEREVLKIYEESEAKAKLFREEAESAQNSASKMEVRRKEEQNHWEGERHNLLEKQAYFEKLYAKERQEREEAERQAREAIDTARALTTSLAETRNQIEELRVQLAHLPELKKKLEEMTATNYKLNLEYESATISIARNREDLLREKEALKRSDEAHRREIQALDREFEARVSKAQLELERSNFQKTLELELQIQKLQKDYNIKEKKRGKHKGGEA